MHDQDHREAIDRIGHALKILDHVSYLAKAKVSEGKPSDRAMAAVEFVPGTTNIALAMRELLEKRLLSPTEILLRAFLDRVGTLSYFRVRGQEGLDVWKRGWPRKERPSFDTKLDMLPEEINAHPNSVDPSKRFELGKLKSEIKSLKASMHSSVHGGPETIGNTIVMQDSDFNYHVIGPDSVNNTYFGNLAHLVVIAIMLFVFELEAACETRGEKVFP